MAHFTGEHRDTAARRDAQSVQVAESVHHAGQCQADQQENEGMAQRQIVVDSAGEHGQQGGGEKQAGPCRQNEDAPLRKAQRGRSVAPPAKEPALEFGDEAHGFRESVPRGSMP